MRKFLANLLHSIAYKLYIPTIEEWEERMREAEKDLIYLDKSLPAKYGAFELMEAMEKKNRERQDDLDRGLFEDYKGPHTIRTLTSEEMQTLYNDGKPLFDASTHSLLTDIELTNDIARMKNESFPKIGDSTGPAITVTASNVAEVFTDLLNHNKAIHNSPLAPDKSSV